MKTEGNTYSFETLIGNKSYITYYIVKNGKSVLHRIDGPAVYDTSRNGAHFNPRYYIYGKEVESQEEVFKIQKFLEANPSIDLMNGEYVWK